LEDNHMNETTWQSLGLDHLPMTDKIHIVEKLWTDLDAEAEAEPVPASHVDELRRRVAESKARPDEGSSWEAVKADIEKEL
jgi:putative addiction module component (TIGR02574 family)